MRQLYTATYTKIIGQRALFLCVVSLLAHSLIVNGTRTHAGPEHVFTREPIHRPQLIGGAHSQEIPTLGLDRPIEHELGSGQMRSYQLVLSQNEYAKVMIEQLGIDVVVRVFAPGQQIDC